MPTPISFLFEWTILDPMYFKAKEALNSSSVQSNRFMKNLKKWHTKILKFAFYCIIIKLAQNAANYKYFFLK